MIASGQSIFVSIPSDEQGSVASGGVSLPYLLEVGL